MYKCGLLTTKQTKQKQTHTHMLKFGRQQKAQKHNYNINMESETCVDYWLRSGKAEEQCDYWVVPLCNCPNLWHWVPADMRWLSSEFGPINIYFLRPWDSWNLTIVQQQAGF